MLYNQLSPENNYLLKKYTINKNEYEEYEELNIFLTEIKKYNKCFDIETLVELFEFVISPQDRIVNGAVYTPKAIRELIVNEVFRYKSYSSGFTVVDISCGCGGFLLTAATFLKRRLGLKYYDIYKKFIFGLDIKEYSVRRTELMLSLLALSSGESMDSFEFNIFTGDALEYDFCRSVKDFTGFDIVIGNPPYVCSRNIPDETKSHLDRWSVCKTGHPDLYIPFFQIGYELLRANGRLGYIVMNTFFKSLNGIALREYIKKRTPNLKIIDFGNIQIFKGKKTYTCICIIQNRKSDRIEYIKNESINYDNNSESSFISYANIDSRRGWNFRYIDIINKIESTGIPLGEIFSTKSGIATLKNDIYIFNPIFEDDRHYILNDGDIYMIEKDICKDIVNPNKISNNRSIENLTQKIIFPYIYNGNKATIIDEQFFMNKYPNAYNYLYSKRDLLSSRDKGRGLYQKWYAFGRNQSLDKIKYKLLFPHITKRIPDCIINNNEDLLFYNGLCVVSENERILRFIRSLFRSSLFWFYITQTSKPYGSGFYSMSRRYIKNFGVIQLYNDEIDYVLNENNSHKLNNFFMLKYGLKYIP